MTTDTMDRNWAVQELDKFLELTALYRPARTPNVLDFSEQMSNRGSQGDIYASAHVVEKIFDRAIPGWRTSVPSDKNEPVNRWYQHREAAQRAKTAILRDAEIALKLGDDAPRLSAGHLHPWVWDAARSLWQSGHYREAVRVASVKINAEAQNKVSRLDISEVDLFNQAFSERPPEPGKPRLRLMPDDGSQTFKSIHRGVRAFAEGCYAAIRNPASHTIQTELPVDHALEQLAAFSVLARWIDDATVER
ncbi:TIGR02391 family protein [Streptomyces sp. KR80]|uniref:TIGR02391 family protein n=1 Tax=Streptomyces sp. KR80 TaxID=3457426 RepID=UPI003FD11138